MTASAIGLSPTHMINHKLCEAEVATDPKVAFKKYQEVLAFLMELPYQEKDELLESNPRIRQSVNEEIHKLRALKADKFASLANELGHKAQLVFAKGDPNDWRNLLWN